MPRNASDCSSFHQPIFLGKQEMQVALQQNLRSIVLQGNKITTPLPPDINQGKVEQPLNIGKGDINIDLILLLYRLLFKDNLMMKEICFIFSEESVFKHL